MTFFPSLVRHTMSAVGGAAVAVGVVDDTNSTEVLGAVLTIISFLWSLWVKRT